MRESMPELDFSTVRRAFDAAAAVYDEHAVLQLEVAQRLLSRLDWLNVQPQTILDLGAGTGQPTARLMNTYPGARVIALDLSTAMLRQARKRGRWLKRPAVVCGNSQALPLADESVDMVFSSLSLQWCDRPELAFAEIRRVLRPDGVFLFSSFGPDTLKELRSSWAAVDDAHHVHAFMDMHDIGDIIVHAGLQEPVMEREVLTLTYDNARAVMRDLKYIGASNALTSRSRGLVGRQRFRQVEQAYEQWRVNGRLPASYEVVYGTAWSGRSARKGMATIAIEDIGKRRGL